MVCAVQGCQITISKHTPQKKKKDIKYVATLKFTYIHFLVIYVYSFLGNLLKCWKLCKVKDLKETRNCLLFLHCGNKKFIWQLWRALRRRSSSSLRNTCSAIRFFVGYYQHQSPFSTLPKMVSSLSFTKYLDFKLNNLNLLFKFFLKLQKLQIKW